MQNNLNMIHKLGIADCTSQLLFPGSSTCNLMTRSECMLLLTTIHKNCEIKFLKFNWLTFNFWDLFFSKIIMIQQISQPSLTASWFQNFLPLFWVWLVRKVNIAIYNWSIPLTSVFTHAFWLTNFVQNVSIRLKIKVMSGKSVSTWCRVIWKST